MNENWEKWVPCMDTRWFGETQDSAVARIRDKDFASWKSKLEPLLGYEKKTHLKETQARAIDWIR
jgi:hypothetical protein